ncbi:MAG: tetratricopeptide repeat protein [Elusimicrobia bacterium]|nr:tetratricopeptide repeat protein [Elusimicrobiota bacterium]MDE2510648.1 tetratricopeptide repeat protein [Elusimicrobiota bacterium]
MKTLSILAAAFLLAPAVRAYDSIHFTEPIKGSELARPVAAASTGDRLYVVDVKKNALLIFDESGKFLKSVGSAGDKPGSFREPRGVATGPAGKIYVADTGNNRVQVFDHDGAYLSSFGEKGSEPGRLRSPESVAVGADGRIYVADTGNDRVQVFTEEGILLYQVGTPGKLPGQLRGPTRVAADPSDEIYVLDRGNDRIQKFDAAAKFMRELPLNGNDMAVDAYGFFYILDGRNGKVIEESPDGLPVGKFGSYGTGVGQMKKAEGVAVTPDGAVIVLDTGNSRIHRVELTDKLKTTPLPMNTAAKLTVTGPTRDWPVAAEALAVLGDEMYAYLPQGGPFAVLGADGKVKSRFGAAKGKGDDVTRASGGLAVSKKLGVYASDTAGSRLQHFSLAGAWQANIGESTGFFDSRKKEGRMIRPNGVAINDDGTVYVADTGNQRIDAFSPEGVFVFSIGPKVGNYMLQEPVAVAWDKAGFLYFVDKGLKKVFKCEPSGAFLAAWGEEGSGPGQFESPVSIAYDGQNYLYTLDSELHRVSVHTKDGVWLTDFFAGGKSDRELLEPAAVAVQDQKLVVADKGKGRILSFDLHPQLAAPADISSSTKEGTVTLAWQPVADPWQDGYQVFRSSLPGGPFAAVGTAKDGKFSDSDVSAYEKYWYRVATVSKTKDVGPWSRPLEVFVAGSFNRAPVEISSVTLGSIFAAKYKWYLKNPVGKVTVTNNVNAPFLNVKVTFKLKDYMDFGFDTEIKKLEPKQTVEIPLIATLNNKVLEVTEDTPIQAEFSLNYFEKGEARTVSLTKPLRLYSRNAITWDDTRKIANFVTYKDEPVKNFKAAVTADFKNRKAGALNPNVVKALKIWNALGEYGIKFAANPANPFETAHDDPNFPVDYTQYPRETLQRKTGQCSDLTSLYAALLEDSEVRVALLDYPGHITLMFDTEADDAAEAGLPPDLLVEHDGSMWLPVEVTLVGKPFYEAVSKAAYAYKAEAEKGRVKVIDLEKAFAEYEPVTMPPTDFTPAAPDAAALQKRYDDQVAVLAKDRYSFLKKTYEDRLVKNSSDSDARLQLGIVELQFGDAAAAAADFNKVLALDPGNAAAENNLGSVAFQNGDFAGAEGWFLKAAEADAADGDVWLNLTKTAVKQGKADKAREYGGKAVALAPAYKPFVDNLVNGL